MRYLIISLSVFMFSCAENPFGENSASSCDHSPNAAVGLPGTCQVSLGNTQNLAIWIDANERSTIVTSSLEVNSFLDKSGNGNNLNFVSGSKSLVSPSAANDRNGIIFDNLEGEYGRETDFNSAMPAHSGLSFFAVIKIDSEAEDSFQITNNNDFNVEIKSDGILQYHIGSGLSESVGGINSSRVLKIAIIYDSESMTSLLYINGVEVNQGSFQPSTLEWLQFSIIGGNQAELLEMLIYSSTKTESEQNEISTYLNNKWGF